MNKSWDQADARQTPVTDGCVWCKGDPTEAIPVGDDEVICQSCFGDLREFNRYKFVELYVSAGLEPATRRIWLDHWSAVQAELSALYEDHDDLFPIPTVKSNADGREHHYTPEQ